MDSASALLSFLAGATVRSALLALPPLALLAVFRGRIGSAAARHAVLFLVAAGMLAMAVLNPLLPAIPLRILSTPAAVELPPIAVPVVGTDAVDSAAPPAPTPSLWARFDLSVLLAAVYFAGLVFCLARLLFGALFTRRLLRGAVPVEADFGAESYESAWISVPLTVGWLRPRILLPAGWREWEAAKLEAVLAHEQNHIQRGDWAIAILAALNRSFYWFNPLAWWLERRLAALAELACDDAALLAVGRRESYAQALLEMAAAVKTGQGRLVWEAMAMAKGTEVRMRIERILDDNRPIPRGLTRSRWMALVACALPLIYFTAVLRPSPAQAQTPAAIAELLKSKPQLNAADAAQIERYLTAHPDDLQARQQVILYYYSAGIRDPRIDHIDWLIANHPDSNEAVVASSGISPQDNVMNTAADYQSVASLWRQQAAAHADDAKVSINAAQFLARPGGDPDEAERILLHARALQPNGGAVASLGRLYASAILATSGDPKFPNEDPGFNNRVRSQIESSTDGMVLASTGIQLTGVARRPQPGEVLRNGVLNLDEHPLLTPAVELGYRLTERAQQQLGRPEVSGPITPMRPMVVRNYGLTVPPPPASGQQATAAAPLAPGPKPVSSAPPVYPPLARQARIQGTVQLAVHISSDGYPTNIRVLRGHPLLVQAALDAVKQWVYPAGSPSTTFAQDVNFSLSDIGEYNQAVAQTAPEPKPPTPQRIKVGGNVQASMLTKQVPPEYPAAAKAAGIQGTVTLQVVIAKDGTVESTTPLEGPPALMPAAQAAVLQWVYKPTKLNGDPIEVSTTVTVPFELNQ